jgi:putative transposase
MTEVGTATVQVPRNQLGPALLPRYARRTGALDEMVPWS